MAEGEDRQDGRSYLEPNFDLFYEAEYRKVLAVVVGVIGQRTVAEELTQEAFLVAHHRWDRIGRYDRPGAFVRRVALNLAVSGRRRRLRELAALERLFHRRRDLDSEPILRGEAAAFWHAVQGLPPRQRQVLALRYVEDFSVGEIAAVLAIAEGSVKAHLHAGRRAVAGVLGVQSEEEDR